MRFRTGYPVTMGRGTQRRLAFIWLIAALPVAVCMAAEASDAPAGLEYTKSWIHVDASHGGRPLVSGDPWDVPVEYYLDPSEHRGTTTLTLWGTGPFIDTPDGKYATRRGHIGYGGLSDRLTLDSPGRGRHVFKFTVPKGLPLVRQDNPVLFVASFRDASGRSWPWDSRANNSFVRRDGFFEIETAVPGNLFTYDEPVVISVRLKNVRQPGETKSLRYAVHDTTGSLVAQGTKEFRVERDGQQVDIPLAVQRRGVFLIEIDVPGWEKRLTNFGRIPDVKAITQGRPTPFGMTVHWDAPAEKAWAVAQRLGMTACRRFTRWYRLQPGPDLYRLDDLAAELDTAAKYGVKEWLCIVDPPPFAFPGKYESTSYRAFDCRWDVWEEFVRTATTRLKGKLYGWEWLNEITPSGCRDPVGTYLSMCRIGTTTAKAIDPGLVTILAGGLYPRSFRTGVLAAGIGQYVDVLPVHYQNGDAILEARQDLQTAGCGQIAVWEDESARGVNAWGVPPIEDLQNTVQCEWVLRQWVDELCAGCEKIIYFGGTGSAAGGWDYLWDDLSPRPATATLAVLASKLFEARPLGSFLAGNGGLLHLFERDGKPVLIASTYENGGEEVALHVGSASLTVTDYQGNETHLAASGGEAAVSLHAVPCFIEGADLDVLKAYVAPQIQVARVGAGTSAGVAASRRIHPRVTVLRGKQGTIAVRLSNLYDRELAGQIEVRSGEAALNSAPARFLIPSGGQERAQLALTIPECLETKDYSASIAVRFDWEKLPRIEKPVILSVISAEMLGNLMPNGDFETPDAKGQGPEGWRVDGKTSLWASATGLGDGLGKHVLRFQNADRWTYASRTIPLRGGQTYLYTAWVRNEDMGCGSNMTQHLAGGREVRLYDSQVMRCGDNNPFWQVFTCRKELPADTQGVSFTPLAQGSGWAMFDNVRVTLFEGSDYVAEALRAAAPPQIDGRLDDWVLECPIPLIGKNQLTAQAADYAWSPDKLSAVGYLMWDDANLYVAFRVRDDVHHATGTGSSDGSDILAGDSLILAIDPTRRGPDAESKSLAYYLSSAAPGGGSGQHTLFRPQAYSGGRPSGHLFRDSSVYSMAVARSQGASVYELRLPWSEVGAAGELGTKIGLSVQLNDNDGHGRIAQLNWGDGLIPQWSPPHFGIVTLVPLHTSIGQKRPLTVPPSM